MTIPVPDLDDRTWPDLVRVAVERMAQVDPSWRADLSVHDPAVVLIDAFAHVTDVLLYRLNRVPLRMYAVFLDFIGAARLRPPTAATAELTFRRTDTATVLTVPAGTRVTVPDAPRAGGPVFRTTAALTLPAGQGEGTVTAVDAEPHDAELLGTGTGLAGQRLLLGAPPAVAGPVRIAVEAEGEQVAPGEGVVVDGRSYRFWSQVDAFADALPTDTVFVLDHVTGTVTFAPALDRGDGRPRPLAVVPAEGRAVRAWYATGGGAGGNVAAGRLTVLRDPLAAGTTVTNTAAASGGRQTEDPAQAAVRAPEEFHARHRAVTARDYELLARAASADVARARAFTRSDLWTFATPGEVEVVLVPSVPPEQAPDGHVDAATVHAHEREQVRADVLAQLQELAPLGARCVVEWASYKTVSVAATVWIRPTEDPDGVRRRITSRLNTLISPFPPDGGSSDASFGRSLHASTLYAALQQQEPGVTHVADVRFLLDEVPQSDITCLATETYQPDTWYAGAGPVLYRTGNAGAGWEPCGRFPDEVVRAVAAYSTPPERPAPGHRPGWVAVATAVDHPDGTSGSSVHVSRDLGEHWVHVATVSGAVHALAWVELRNDPQLLLASDDGLYEVAPDEGATPDLKVVDPAATTTGSYAVASFVDYRGRQGVVVTQQASGGVWVARVDGELGSFVQARTAGEDVRTVAVQYDGPVTWLWAARAGADASATGCVRLRIDDLTDLDPARSAPSWVAVDAGWTGGECWDVAFGGTSAYAATQGGGVLSLDLSDSAATWHRWPVDSGLPRRDSPPPPFEPVQTVATDRSGTVVLAGGAQGVFRLDPASQRWRLAASAVVPDTVTLPDTWLFCSGAHQIDVQVER